MKTCKVCEFNGEDSLFISGKRICKSCHNGRRRELYKDPARKQRILKVNREYRQKNLEVYRAEKREYERQHKEAARLRGLKFRLKDADGIARKKREYYYANAESIREKVKKWRSANLDKKRAVNGRRRARQRNAAGSEYTTQRHITWRWQMWGNRCWVCKDIATATDHVFPLCDGGTHWPSNLRPICKSCNSRRSKKRSVAIREVLATPAMRSSRS